MKPSFFTTNQPRVTFSDLLILLNKISLPLVSTLLILSSLAHAESRVFIQNNTTKTLKFNVKSTSSTSQNNYWKRKNTTIFPGARGEIFETERGDVIKKGKDYLFKTDVTIVDPNTNKVVSQNPYGLQLYLHVRGTDLNSHMKQGVTDQKGQLHLRDDRKKVNIKMNAGSKQWNVKFWSFFTGGDDNVEYVFQEEYPLPIRPQDIGLKGENALQWEETTLKILSYNIYMRPTHDTPTPLTPGLIIGPGKFFNGQSIRADLIPDKILGYDVVVFQEAFDDDVREKILDALKTKGYPYQSRILGKDREFEQDGGVIIVSKWPLVGGKGKQKLFGDLCSGGNCFSDKGVLYIKIDKEVRKGRHNYFHIFGTHLDDGEFEKIKYPQLKIIKEFIDAQKISPNEPVIIAGDMNVNLLSETTYPNLGGKTAFDIMLQTLGAAYFPPNQRKGASYTYNKGINPLATSQSYYDYILYSTNHKIIPRPLAGDQDFSFAEVRVLRANDEWKEFPHEKAKWDLSDHFPIYGHLEFSSRPYESFNFDIPTAGLVRYWNKNKNDMAALTPKQGIDAYQRHNYERVGVYGSLVKNEAEALRWFNKPVTQHQAKVLKKGKQLLPIFKNKQNKKPSSPKQGWHKKKEKGTIERIRPAKKTYSTKVRPLKLYWSEKWQDYMSTTIEARGKDAVEGPGQYKFVDIQGYVFSKFWVDKLPAWQRNNLLAMYSYYNDQLHDHLIATSKADIASAEENGYKQLGLEGFIISGNQSKQPCKTNAECPVEFICKIPPGPKIGRGKPGICDLPDLK